MASVRRAGIQVTILQAKTKMKKPENLTIKEVEKAIDMPAQRWHGKCFEIATAIVEANLVSGVAVYGHYLGHVDPDGYWGARANAPFFQHGWILLDDGRILDPTRWSFEDDQPYLALFSKDEDGDDYFGDYDEGGNQWRKAMLRPCPPPSKNGRKEPLKLSNEAKRFVSCLLADGVTPENMCVEHVSWLANANYDDLGEFVYEIYRAICQLPHGSAFIPIDNHRRCEREHGALEEE